MRMKLCQRKGWRSGVTDILEKACTDTNFTLVKYCFKSFTEYSKITHKINMDEQTGRSFCVSKRLIRFRFQINGS